MKKILTWSVIIIVVAGSIFIYWKFYFTYSEGHRAGLLQKFSYKGTMFKTWEGEMIMSSVQSDKNVALASEKFLFSVADPVLAKQMEKLEGQILILHYKEKNGSLWWRGDTPYIVDSLTLKNDQN
jgi:hypothetical protein